MKITENKTHYDTRKLRTLICAVYNRLKKVEGPLRQWKTLDVEIRYNNADTQGRYYVTGQAIVKGYWLRICIPRSRADTRRVAWTIEHELLHIYGYEHKNMGRNHPKWDGIKYQYAWAEELIGEYIPIKTPTPKAKYTTFEKQTLMYTPLCARERRWLTKFKRAQNALAKIKKSKKYYEKQLGIAAKGT